jgi:hypothetical protein
LTERDASTFFDSQRNVLPELVNGGKRVDFIVVDILFGRTF